MADFIDDIQNAIKQNAQINGGKDLEKIQSVYKRLQEIKTLLQQYYTRVKSQNKTKWRNVITDTYRINWKRVQLNETNQKDFIQLIFEAYTLTTTFLSEIGQIHNINTTISFIDNNNYFRMDNMKLSIDYLKLDQRSSKRGGGFGIRLNQQALKAEKEKQMEIDTQEKLSQHFNDFFQPFIEYQKHNTSGWKMNRGVAAEAFERHLEQVSHLDNYSSADFGSVGDRWQLYLQSKGSDPFFTGPDTILAQVKTSKASLISDPRTVLYALNGILQIFEESGIIKSNIDSEIVEKIFKQNTNIKAIMRQDVFRELQEQSPQVIQSILKSIVQQQGGKITLITKKGKKSSRKTYTINTENWKLEGFI